MYSRSIVKYYKRYLLLAFFSLTAILVVSCTSVSRYQHGHYYYKKALKFQKEKSSENDGTLNKDSAIANFQLAFNEYERLYREEEKTELLILQINTLLELGKLLPSIRRNSEVNIELMTGLLNRLEERTGGRHKEILIKGYKYLLRSYSQRMEFLKQIRASNKIYSLLSLNGDIPPIELNFHYTNLARAYTNTNQIDSAKYYSRKILNIKNNEPNSHNLAYKILADCCEQAGQLDSAIAYIKLANELSLKRSNKAGLTVISDYASLVELYMMKGEYQLALEKCRETIDYCRRGNLGEQNGIYTIYKLMGTILKTLGDYSGAIDYFKKGLEIEKQMLPKIKDSSAVNRSYLYLSQSYSLHGNFDQALEYALIARKDAFTHFTPNSQLIRIHDQLATVYSKMGMLTEALAHIDTSESIDRNISRQNGVPSDSNYYFRGDVYFFCGKYDLAIRNYLQYIQKKEKFPNLASSLVFAHNNCSMSYFEKKDYLSALKHAHYAIIKNTVSFNDTSVYSYPHNDMIISEKPMIISLMLKIGALTELYNQRKEINLLLLAHQGSQQLIALIEQLRHQYLSEASKLFLTEQSFSVYETGIRNALALYDLTSQEKYLYDAFQICEQSKTRSLYDAISESNALKSADIPDSLLNFDMELKRKMINLSTALTMENEKQVPNDSLIKKYQSELFGLKKDQRFFIGELEKRFPAYYNLKFRTGNVDPGQLQKKLGKSEVLIEYFLSNKYLYIFTCSKNTFNVTPVPIDSGFFQSADRFYKLLQKKTALIRRDTRLEYINHGSFLFDRLIAPVKHLLGSKKELVIIPADMLYTIPFEALPVDNKDADFSQLNYMVRHYTISYHYSSSIKYNSPYQFPDRRQYGFLGFAPVAVDSSSDISDYSGKEVLQSDKTALKPGIASDEEEKIRYVFDNISDGLSKKLPFAGDEIKSIGELFRKSEKPFEVYLNNSASEENFKHWLSTRSYRCLHIATHGFADEKNPNLSGLILAPSDSNSAEDGILHAEELFNLRINADIAVLSSCESGVGKLYKGEGMLAITRGFLHAGVPNLVFSLWKVSDRQTRSLMIEFYKNVLAGHTYQNSLRQAKLKLLQNSNSAIPYYWSSFILVGR